MAFQSFKSMEGIQNEFIQKPRRQQTVLSNCNKIGVLHKAFVFSQIFFFNVEGENCRT